MSQPDSVTPAQLIAILEASGFYQEHDGDQWFMNSDRTRVNGPSAIYIDISTATTLPLGVIRLYLLEHGMHPAYLDRAISRVLGPPP